MKNYFINLYLYIFLNTQTPFSLYLTNNEYMSIIHSIKNSYFCRKQNTNAGHNEKQF